MTDLIQQAQSEAGRIAFLALITGMIAMHFCQDTREKRNRTRTKAEPWKRHTK